MFATISRSMLLQARQDKRIMRRVLARLVTFGSDGRARMLVGGWVSPNHLPVIALQRQRKMTKLPTWRFWCVRARLR
jgi:hypothetical protein